MKSGRYQYPHYREVLLIFAASVLLTLFFVLTDRVTKQVLADQDGHSHFRFGHITWEYKAEDSPNTARITFIAGFRRNGFTCTNPLSGTSVPCSEADGLPGIGDVFLETIGLTRIDNFGDGSSTGTLYFKVFSFDTDNNWLMARALQPGTADQEYIKHTYPGTGPFTIVMDSCCRTSAQLQPNVHINNPDRNYRLEAIVDFRTTASPISLLPPIVDCPVESICRFTVASVDPDAPDPEAPRLRWRLASPEEMGGSTLTQPTGASINSQNGVYAHIPHP